MLAALAIALTVSGILSWLLANAGGYWLVPDMPNDRSLHSRPTPRTGGIAMLLGSGAGLFAAWLWQGIVIIGLPLTISILVLAIVALVDDRRDLNAGLRLLIQTGLVAWLLYSYQIPDPGVLLTIALLLFWVWMINLYNFMDGMDGFAAGMAMFGFGTFAALAWQAGHVELALGCAVTVAACAGFLMLNFPPAKLFMGDAGSTVLGLLAGSVILLSHVENILPLWLGILIFSPFVVDASITLTTRMWHGERFWLPHRTHYYQRLVRIGWGHRQTLLAEYTLMTACCGSAIIASNLPLAGQWAIMALWGLIYIVLIRAVSMAERHLSK